MTRFWERSVERYANEPFAWFQPKGFTIKPSNLPIIRDKLAVLQRFDGKHWRRVQRRYTDALRREGLFKPRAARRDSTDYAAIVRMNKEVFDSLGLVWVSNDSIIQITPAGHSFLACSLLHRPRPRSRARPRFRLAGAQGKIEEDDEDENEHD